MKSVSKKRGLAPTTLRLTGNCAGCPRFSSCGQMMDGFPNIGERPPLTPSNSRQAQRYNPLANSRVRLVLAPAAVDCYKLLSFVRFATSIFRRIATNNPRLCPILKWGGTAKGSDRGGDL